MKSLRNRDSFFALILLAATFLAYQPAWHAGFIWDDDTFLLNNRLIHADDGLIRFWFTTTPRDYFPLTFTSLWLEWRLWGAHPLGYHLINILLHAGGVILLWRALLRLAPKMPGAAWFAAAIFALHPVNVESVAWITERKNTLAMFFYAAALLAFLKFEDSQESGDHMLSPRWKWYLTAALCFLLAMLSKTAVTPFPLVLLGIAWWRRGRVERQDIFRSIPFFTIALALGLVTLWFQTNRAIGTDVVRAEGVGARLAGAGCAIWFYLYKLLWPANLIFVYPRWRIGASNPLSYAPGLLALIGLLICWRYRRTWGRACVFGLGYFVVMLLPILGFANIYFMRYSLVADHWQYFAMMGPIALLAAGAARVSNLLGEEWSKSLESRRRIERTLQALGAILLVILGAMTWRQAGMYHDEETLWRRTIDRNPNCYLAHIGLGKLLLRQRAADEALAEFQKAREIRPEDPEVYNNLGAVLLDAGRVDEALAQYQKAIALKPDFAEAHYNLARALSSLGRTGEAIGQFQEALRLQTDLAEAHDNLANIYLIRGQIDQAIAECNAALESRPDDADARDSLGVALLQKGQANAAIAEFRKAVSINPQLAAARYNLAGALAAPGQRSEAITQYESALKIRPNDVDTANDLAWLLATCPENSLRNAARAVELAEMANRLSGGESAPVLRTLAAAYAEAGRFGEAITNVQRALRLAVAMNNGELAADLRARLEKYQASTNR